MDLLSSSSSSSSSSPLLLLLLLTLSGCCAAQEILPEGPVEAVVGRNVTLKTLLDKPVYTFIVWNFNDGTEQNNIATQTKTGLKEKEGYEGRVSIDPMTGSLTLVGLKPDDSGDYSITIITEDGTTRTAETKLQVLEPVSDVAIKSNLPEAIEHNSTVALNCSAKGSFLTFAWINGSAPIVADGKRLTVTAEEESSLLTIAGVLRSDLVGPIFCSVANKLETEKSAPFNLTVYYGPDDVIITPANPPQYVQSGSDFNLSCSAVSSPDATFSWFRDQQQLEHVGSVLPLGTIQKHDFPKAPGKYTCVASNAKTKRTGTSAAVTFDIMDAIAGAKVSGPTALLLAGNSSANLSCKATAGNVMTTAWLKDGKPLAAGGRVAFAADMSSVMIDLLQKEDNGVYTCELSNAVSKVTDSYKMAVNYGPEPATVSGEDAVEVNDPVTLTCSAPSVPPANFTWTFNGTLTDVKTATFTLDKAVYKNTGTYTCEAHNSVTGKTTRTTHNLSVKAEGALDEGLSDGAIAGIIIGVLVALAAAIGLIIYCRQKVPVESPY